MDVFSDARAKLKVLATEASPEKLLNEATTRLRFIDRLLTECLQWPQTQIVAERYHEGDYVDYALGSPATEWILEAKRESVGFELPAGIAGRRSVDVQTLIQDADTNAAIMQVLRYCQTQGVPVAAICNGHQLAAFYASRQDGTPPLHGQALCFSSLQEMIDDFETLWNHLSREGMAARNLQRVLLGPRTHTLPAPKLSASIIQYPGFRNRSPLETDLKILGGLFIQDLESEDTISEEFLRECYCKSGALSQYALVSKEILRARYAGVSSASNIQTQPVRTQRGLDKRLSPDMMTAALTRRPIIVLGDVGVGKSMFLKHLIRVEAADALAKSLVFYVNFGTEPALETNLEEHVTRRIARQLLDDYDVDIDEHGFVRAVYNGEINRFKRGINKDLVDTDFAEFSRRELAMLSEQTAARSTHLNRALTHLRTTSGRSTVVVLDNIDQRPPEFQDRVFLIAQGLAERWSAAVFVALRPATFYASKSKGSLAAYQLRVFTVSPTRVDEVVSRRLGFARSQLVRTTSEGSFPPNLSLTGDDLITYMDVLIKAFSENVKLKELLDNLSGGNLRLALTFLSAFVGSGYVSTQRVLDVAAAGDIYTLPMHEFLRSIIFGEYEFFDPRASEICNLFDTTSDDGREHFLLPILLAHAQRVGEAAGGDGFVEVPVLYKLAQGLGFRQEQVAPHLGRAIDKRLLEAPPGKDGSGPLRITTIGSYMYNSMMRSFVYIDAMVVDTPIAEITTRRQIEDVRSITDRLNRAEIFVDYLDDQWNRLQVTSEEVFDWPAAAHALNEDIQTARMRADRAAQRRRLDERT